jgi:probable rRNA maturation factor
MIRIFIANRQQALAIDRPRLRRIVRAVLKGEGVQEAELTLAFVDNVTIHLLNRQFLKHDAPTDVLAFPSSEGGTQPLEGEVVVGAEVALTQAELRGHRAEDELALYVIHGLLHLCGYRDKTARQRKAMREQERVYLTSLGLPDVFKDNHGAH